MPKPTTKSRQELRSRFVRNAIPTEADFADLIAASLNQADDGLLRLPDQSLGVARPKAEVPVLRFFADPAAETAVWQMQLLGTDKPGFGLSSPTGPTALFLDGTTGNVGIGTTTAGHKLTVEGNWTNSQAPGSDLTSSGILAIRSDRPQLDFIDTDANSKDWAIQVNGSKMWFIRSPFESSDLVLDGTGNVGIGTDNPGHKLTVAGIFTDAQNSSSDLTYRGIFGIRSNCPQLDFIDTDANNKDWAIHVNGNKMFFISSPWDDANLVLDGAGNVGIGTQTPAHKLVIDGGTGWKTNKDSQSGITYGGALAIKSTAPQIDFIDTTNSTDWAIHVAGKKMYFIRSPWVTDFMLDGAGNVGIGTESPAQRLTVQGPWNAGKDTDSSLTNGGTLAIKSDSPQLDFIDSSSNAKDWAIHVNDGKMAFIRSPWEYSDLFLDGTGNVGIGTDYPSHRLTVSGTWPNSQASGSDLTKAGILSIRSNCPQLDFVDTDANNKDWAIHVNDSVMYFICSPWSDANLVLNGAGNVGIGTQTPAHKLVIDGGTGWKTDKDSQSGITYGGALAIKSTAPQIDFIDTTNSTDWAIHVAGKKMYFIRSPWVTDFMLDGAGNVGIGTESPAQRLTVQGTWNAGKDSASSLSNGGMLAIKGDAPQLDFIDSDTNAQDWCIHVNNNKLFFIRSPWEYSDLMLDGTGNVGIGTDAPTAKLHVGGTFCQTQNSNKFSMTTRGTNVLFTLEKSNHGNNRAIYWDGDTNWDQESDETLKTDIEGMTNILPRLARIDVKTYRWKGDGPTTRKQIGFLAQEVRESFPDLVKEGSSSMADGTTKLRLNYTNFGVLAVGAIKELKASFDQEMAELRTVIAELRHQLDRVRGEVGSAAADAPEGTR